MWLVFARRQEDQDSEPTYAQHSMTSEVMAAMLEVT